MILTLKKNSKLLAWEKPRLKGHSCRRRKNLRRLKSCKIKSERREQKRRKRIGGNRKEQNPFSEGAIRGKEEDGGAANED